MIVAPKRFSLHWSQEEMVLADPVGVCHNTNVDNLNNNYDDDGDACR